jgi:hypothetical protein
MEPEAAPCTDEIEVMPTMIVAGIDAYCLFSADDLANRLSILFIAR